MELRNLLNFALLLGVIAILVGILSQVLAGIQESQCPSGTVYDEEACWSCPTGFAYDTSANNCYNTSNTSQTTSATLANTIAANVTGKGLESQKELATWLPTIGMVAAAVVLLGFIIGIFSYFRSREQ